MFYNTKLLLLRKIRLMIELQVPTFSQKKTIHLNDEWSQSIFIKSLLLML